MNTINNPGYECPKCRNTRKEIGEMYVAGGFWSKIFNLQRNHFTTITCSKCKFTEFYKGSSAELGENILDFLTN